MNYRYIESPIGALLLAGEGAGLVYIGFPEGKGKVVPAEDWEEVSDCYVEAEQQLSEYFRGERTEFSMKLAPHGTRFQLQFLDALQKIPYGSTCTYRDIAESIGRIKAVRAVGAANGRNPLPIVIPCHRVIGTNGSLTGFGGGLDTKKYLLELESQGSEDFQLV